MTWNELKRRIDEMSPAARRQSVTFLEPYTDETPIEAGMLWKANKQATEKRPYAKIGHYYLGR